MAETRKEECDFCRIVSGEDEAGLIYEDEATLAFVPLAPATRGHTLVVPKRHVVDLLDATDVLLGQVISTTRRVAEAIRDALHPGGFNLITSSGDAATQTVFHLHFHIVPRWGHDRMGDIWPPKSPYLEETKDDVAELIRASLRPS
jgi:histidine triad (HIT) family protein